MQPSSTNRPVALRQLDDHGQGTCIQTVSQSAFTSRQSRSRPKHLIRNEGLPDLREHTRHCQYMSASHIICSTLDGMVAREVLYRRSPAQSMSNVLYRIEKLANHIQSEADDRHFSGPAKMEFVLKKILQSKRDRIIVLPAIGSQLITTTSLFLMPVLIGTLQVKRGLTGTVAGLLLSMELVVSSFTTLFLSACFNGHSTRRWALFGGSLTIAGTALTLISPAIPMLVVTRLIAGIGAGIVGAEATRVLSRGVEKEKLIATVTIASIVNAAIWLAVLPYLVDRLGYRGHIFVCCLSAWVEPAC